MDIRDLVVIGAGPQQIVRAVHAAAEGELVGIAVKWRHDKREVHSDKLADSRAHMMHLKSFRHNVKDYGGVVLCDRKAAHREARVLQTDLSRVLKQPVLIGGDLWANCSLISRELAAD